MINELSFDRLYELCRGQEFDGVDATNAADLYGRDNAIEVETGVFLYGLVRRMRPQLVVETGTMKGFSGAWIACALADNYYLSTSRKPGHLFTIDTYGYDGLPESLWSGIRVTDFVTHLIEFSQHAEIPGTEPINMLFLDADYGDRFEAEFENFYPRLSPTCLVAIHDTKMDPLARRAAQKAVGILQRDGLMVSRMGLDTMRGLELIQRRGG